jgi:hypothetical protein
MAAAIRRVLGLRTGSRIAVSGSLVAVLLVGATPPVGADFTKERKFSARQHDDWEPAIAADDLGHVYWATTRYGARRACASCPRPAILIRRSDDGGHTWSRPRFICRCPGVEGQHDPVLATDRRGRVFFTWMNDFHVHFARSDDFGRTWTDPVPLDEGLRFSDKPWIGTSSNGEDVYVTYNGNGPAPGAPYVVSSHDAGDTWSQPVRATRNVRYWFADGLTVTADGTVLTSQNVPTQDYTGTWLLKVLVSHDGGMSWDVLLLDRSNEPPPCPGFAGCDYPLPSPQTAIASHGGRVYLLYTANRRTFGPGRLYFRYSKDNGETWSLPLEIARRKGVDHGFPMIAAQGNGDVRIAWLDDRTGRWNAWHRRSTDGGASWSRAVRLSNRAAGAPYKTAAGFKFPYGDYGQVAIDSDGRSQVTWGEGPSYIGPGGSWYARGI